MLNVPDNTIAYFVDPEISNNINIDDIICRPEKTRDWFTSHFYRCMPLAIANQYGFIVRSPRDYFITWNGGEDYQDTIVFPFESVEDNQPVFLQSHFGSGIVTVTLRIMLRTPPGVNLLTIPPPNYLLPNITPMTGVIETDNLRYTFNFNLKIDTANQTIKIPKGYPIGAFIPIPRYYQDNFVLKNAEEVFDEETISEELTARYDGVLNRILIDPKQKNMVSRLYYLGKDIYGNIFKDHQKPADI